MTAPTRSVEINKESSAFFTKNSIRARLRRYKRKDRILFFWFVNPPEGSPRKNEILISTPSEYECVAIRK